ncbi:MCE family protein [Nocardioides pocheonensis]|jgi:phospholipid/cholesterol/gamma-HCH transport system substrate-binding protein|uniref:MCE family protein n=1 Tax=Nocardioides pocheonensis TaxID=661485 RepID=A0A3N0GH09_9ACTN|nr:MlaD family protein [Nocardioides pocheonensis]RNM11753.1 MCE family protein [Nocardioides pocheonensis]
MLTSRTKRQLVAFLVLTLVGTTYVGARYARLDLLFVDSSYQVTAQLAQSGGIFTGAEVSYRGVKVGSVCDMRLTRTGVDAILCIDNTWADIPADTFAEVGNMSPLGEQYIDLQPRSDAGPHLKEGSVIGRRDTAVQVSPTQFLTSVDAFVSSVPQDSLRTTVSELGTAFQGTGDDLGRLIDNSNEFIKTATDNLDVTTALIQQSNTVLGTQAAKGSALRSFARDLALFSDTLADNDEALRTLIDNGSATVSQLHTFLEQNGVDLAELINNLVTTGEIAVKRLPGIRQLLVVYPYVVAQGYTLGVKSPEGHQVRLGLVLSSQPSCRNGYDPKEWRSPSDGSNRPMDEDAHCADPPTKSNPRGAQNAPRVAPGSLGGQDVATYDLGTGQLTWNDQNRPGTDLTGNGVWTNGDLEGLLLLPLS